MQNEENKKERKTEKTFREKKEKKMQKYCQVLVETLKRNAYNTRYSQAVTHPSTDRARRCLTSVIGREPVFSTWYGRRQQMKINKHSYAFTPHFMQISTHIHNIHVKWIVNKRYI